jgi:16S rRNA (adenine1518-N6/adenine1519-N6)-dimethyltransferase
VTAAAGEGAYGALSIGVQAVARAERLFVVPAGAFHPRPKVDSAVLRLTPLESPLVRDAEVPMFRRLAGGTLRLPPEAAGPGVRELTGWAPEQVAELLARAEVDPAARPETLEPEAFVRLLHALVDGGWAGK